MSTISDPAKFAGARFDLVDFPVALPGHCFSCRSTERDQYIDLRFDIEFEDQLSASGAVEPGAVYICDKCIGQWADMLEFISPENARKLQESEEKLREDNYKLVTRNKKLEEIIYALGYVLIRDGVDADSIINRLMDNDSAKKPVTSNSKSSNSGNRKTSSNKSGSPEQGSKSGLGDIFSP